VITELQHHNARLVIGRRGKWWDKWLPHCTSALSHGGDRHENTENRNSETTREHGALLSGSVGQHINGLLQHFCRKTLKRSRITKNWKNYPVFTIIPQKQA
jgi:hypothetical protein